MSAEGSGKQLDRSSGSAGNASRNPSLDGLRDELGDAAVERFVAHYLALLDERIISIGCSMQECRIDSCITLLLTLETSSHMVGATDLCRRATALRRALDQHRADTADLYTELVDAGRSTRELLAAS